MASATLMGLPRELRDEIFSYLYEDTPILKFWVQYNLTNDPPRAAEVRIRNGPIRAVLHTHPQLRHEHLRTRSYRATVTIDIVMLHDWQTHGVGQKAAYPELLKAISHVREVTLYLHIGRYHGWPETVVLPWSHVLAVVKPMCAEMPQLSAVRVVVPMEGHKLFAHPRLQSQKFNYEYGTGRKRFATSPRPQLGDLFIRRSGDGYKLDFQKVAMNRQSYRPTQVMHRLTVIAVYLFSRTAGIKELLTKEIMQDPATSMRYPDEALALLHEEEREKVRHWPVEMRGWREQEIDYRKVNEGA
jgi:hypothetical protein